MRYEKSVFMGDVHVPFQNAPSLLALRRFMKAFMPDRIYLVGDIMDFYAVSSFDKDPERITGLQDEIDQTIQLLSTIRREHSNTKIIYLEGNHEARLQRYLYKHPEISSLNALSMNNLLSLRALDIDWIKQTTSHIYHKFIIEHGDIVRQQSAYTARAQLEKRGLSGLSGHTHRLGTHYHSDMSGDYVWCENGCLCELNPEYVVGKPNWLNGFSVGYFKHGRDNRFSIEQIPIIKGKIMYAGEEY